MIYYDRIDVSEGIDVNKTSASKECDVCHYWHFLNLSLKFQANVCNWCHGLLMMSVNLSNIAILNIKVYDYCCIISLVSKNKATVFSPISGHCWYKKNFSLIGGVRFLESFSILVLVSRIKYFPVSIRCSWIN